MTVLNPPGFLQNAGATHTAEQFRNWMSILIAGNASSTSLIARQGVHPSLGNALQVTQSGAPGMSVVVKSGHAVIGGTQASKQGIYLVANDADVTLSIGASHATLNRIDSVIFKVEDTAYAGGVNSSSVVVVAGTPASSPSAPSLPANCIELAQVSILALDTSITNSEITDRRVYLAATGAPIPVANTAALTALTGTYNGMLAWQRDTFRGMAYNGTAWAPAGFGRPIVARMRQTTLQTLTNATDTALTFTTEDFDTDNAHSTSSNTSRYVFPYDGKYLLSGGCTFAVNATGVRILTWSINGTAVNGSGSSMPGSASTAGNRVPARAVIVNVTAGQYAELIAFQNSGGNLDTNVTTSEQPSMEVMYIGPGWT